MAERRPRRPKRASDTRIHSFLIVMNNYTEDDIKSTLATFTANGCSYLFQEEKGERDGTPHLQGYFRLKNAATFATVKSWFPQNPHLEAVKNWRAVIKYSCKEETRAGRIFNSPDIKVPQVAQDPLTLPDRDLLGWQEECISIIPDVNDRELHWWVDKAGGRGKTSLCKHLVLKHNACYVAGKGTDVKYLVSNWIVKRGCFPKLIVINLTRTLENFVNYGVLEEIKDGLFVSNKYKTTAIVMDSPQVFIFANFAPDLRKMTADRWVVHDLDEQYESEEEEEKRPKRPRYGPAGAGASASASVREDMEMEEEREVSDDGLDHKHND